MNFVDSGSFVMFAVSLALVLAPFVLGFLPKNVGISYRIGSSELCLGRLRHL